MNASTPDTFEESPLKTENLLREIDRLKDQVKANERNERIQNAVFKIARTSTTAENMESLYHTIHEVVAELTSIDAIFIALYHEAEACLSFPYYVDRFDDEQQEEETPLKNREMIPIEKCEGMLTWKVITSNEVIRYKSKTDTETRSFGKSSQDWLGIPLQHAGKPIGVFSIQSYQPGFVYRDEEVDLMVFISRHIASALQHLRDRDSLKKANQELSDSAGQLANTNAQLKTEMEERALINKRMVELSHQAGKAEIATGILHNVGNVLNSINVSAGLAQEILRASRISSLGSAASLLTEQDDLGAFFATDRRGHAFPEYLSNLSKVLEIENTNVQSELKTLTHHLDHVKTVVAMQQTYAGLSGLQESVSIPELFEDAKLLIASSLTRHEVAVTREFDSLPRLMLEKQKLLQIIVNLLQNAKDSLTAGRSDDRKLLIRVFRTSEEQFQIEFIDNGQGIAPENLTRIFSHGFTTKKDGHGFGLHSCANAMSEMGGQLSAHSDGPNTGATFTLQLPFILAESTFAGNEEEK